MALNGPLQLIITSYAIYTRLYAYTKQNFCWYFDAGLEHMAAHPPGNGRFFDWLSNSCDISACDLSPERNPEKYGRPMKLVIANKPYHDEMPGSTAFHLGIHCLLKYTFREFHLKRVKLCDHLFGKVNP